MSSSIVVFQRGQLSSKDKERLTKHGIVYVEADDPSKVVVLASIVPTASADDLFMAALYAASEGCQGQRFTDALYRRLKANEQARAGNPTGEPKQ